MHKKNKKIKVGTRVTWPYVRGTEGGTVTVVWGTGKGNAAVATAAVAWDNGREGLVALHELEVLDA